MTCFSSIQNNRLKEIVLTVGGKTIKIPMKRDFNKSGDKTERDAPEWVVNKIAGCCPRQSAVRWAIATGRYIEIHC